MSTMLLELPTQSSSKALHCSSMQLLSLTFVNHSSVSGWFGWFELSLAMAPQHLQPSVYAKETRETV
eukprot:2532002-Amphidinium_carterae.1